MLRKQNGEPFKFQKVFGLGLGKTATTSLTEALEDLGYHKAIHFPIDRMGLVFRGYYDAATDTPIAYNFQELLEKFPDAGFILSTRDIESWLKSMETHMTVGRGRHGARRSEIAKLRKDLYGHKHFNKDIYKVAYKSHIIKVLEVFGDLNKYEQLFINNFVDYPEWDKLCEFLDLPVPAHPFPHLNKGSYKTKNSK